jgi:hypothetical protein
MGGSGSFSSLRSNADEIYFNKQGTLTLSGNFGYFFIDKFAAGIKLSYTNEKDIVDGSMPGTENVGVNRNIQAGPFIRYYLLNEELPYNVSAEVSAEFGQNTGKNGTIGSSNIQKSRLKRMTYTFLAGPEFFLNTAIGIHLQIGYTVNRYSSPYSATTNGFLTVVGFQWHLESK